MINSLTNYSRLQEMRNSGACPDCGKNEDLSETIENLSRMGDEEGKINMAKSDKKLNSLGGIPILYEDNHLLAVVKPVGLSSQGGEGISENVLDRLKDAIKKRDNKPGSVYLALVHRLDQPVGGVLLLAKTSKAASRMAEQLQKHEMEKRYLAVCTAIPTEKSGRLEDLLLKNRKENQTRVVESGTKDARFAKASSLEYKCLDSDPRFNLALLEIKLETGRSHQIRVQLAEAGWPLWGDYRYNTAWKLAKPGETVALWATYLAFLHPVSHERIELISKPAPDEPWRTFAEYL